MSETCPVCRSRVSDSKDVSLPIMGLHGSYISCPRCGDYQIESFTAKQVTDLRLDPQSMAVLSHWIRTRFEAVKKGERNGAGNGGSIILYEKLVESIIKNPHASPREQADAFIRWIGDSSGVGGQYVPVDQLAIQAIVGSATYDEFRLVFEYLEDKAIIRAETTGQGRGRVLSRVLLLFAGWERYQELKRATSDSRKAFMAMQYNEAELESLVENVFKPAVKQTGFDLSVLRDNREAGLIDNKLRVDIRTARFLIADLTHRNPGAYWEAGYAEGLGKPVIYTCEKKVFEDQKSKPHFDTNHHLTILWDSTKPDDPAKELKATIRATLPAEAKLTDD